ncbi:MAG: flagellin [Magnetovibrionaceae bacterium]
MTDITLSTAVRSNLLSLQNTAGFIDRTQSRLSTGLKVASPTDDAVKFFQAKSLSDRAIDLGNRKSAVDQGISSLDTALKATEAIEQLVSQLKGIVDSARSGDETQRKDFGAQLREIADQIEKLVEDASYQGLNLLNSSASKLSVRFSDKTDSKLDVDGIDFQSSAFFLTSAGVAIGAAGVSTDGVISGVLGFSELLSSFNFDDSSDLASFNAQADLAITRLDQVISNVQSQSATLATNVAILQVRSDFTKEYINTLETGAGKLTVADLNEEGANLLALQTRQQLGIQALSFAGQSEQSILGLFG